MRLRLAPKAVGLCALMLGLMLFVSSAQAEKISKWAIVKTNGELVTISPEGDGKGKGDTLLPEVQVKEIETLPATGVKEIILLTTVASIPTAFLCTALSLKNSAGTGAPKLLLEGKILGKATFTGCLTKLNGATSAVCKPHSKGEVEGTVTTQLFEALIVLHASAPEGTVLKIFSDVVLSEPLVTFILGKEGIENECSIGEKLPASGELALQDTEFKKENADHLVSEYDPLTHMWVLNLTPEHEVKADGSALLVLEGEHKGLKWGGLPG